jgi:hypothetical protein
VFLSQDTTLMGFFYLQLTITKHIVNIGILGTTYAHKIEWTRYGAHIDNRWLYSIQ